MGMIVPPAALAGGWDGPDVVKKFDIGIVNDLAVAAAGALLAHTHSTALAGESGTASAAPELGELLIAYWVFIRRDIVAQPWGKR